MLGHQEVNFLALDLNLGPPGYKIVYLPLIYLLSFPDSFHSLFFISVFCSQGGISEQVLQRRRLPVCCILV